MVKAVTRPHRLQVTVHTAGAPVRGVATYRALGRFDQAVDLRTRWHPIGRVTEQPCLVPDEKGGYCALRLDVADR